MNNLLSKMKSTQNLGKEGKKGDKYPGNKELYVTVWVCRTLSVVFDPTLCHSF